MKETQLEQRCSQLLRDIRRKKGVTLHDVQRLSNGQIKAVVLGSYERGTRAISLARISQLAEFYEVPVDYFFGGTPIAVNENLERLIFDARRIKQLDISDGIFEHVKSFLNRIAQLRRDWNGEVLSIRKSDSETISLITSLTESDLRNYLQSKRMLFGPEVSGQRSL